MIPRRTFTKLLAAVPAFSSSLSAASETLRDAGARKNLLVGSAVSYRQLERDDYRTLLANQASILVSENDMKWQLVHPEVDRYDFSHPDALVGFAKKENQKVRGHNLCWHNQLPRWFPSVATPENAGDLLRRHIAEVAGRYRGRIHSWDVVNDAFVNLIWPHFDHYVPLLSSSPPVLIAQRRLSCLHAGNCAGVGMTAPQHVDGCGLSCW